MSHGTKEGLKDGVIDFIAGSLGGVASVYVGQPLDTVKVKLQTFPHLYKSMFDCVNQIITKEGLVRGLYAGTVPAVVANVAENSVLFAAYGGCQKFIKFLTNTDKQESLSPLGNASAGCLAAFFSSFSLCPTELIKCKMQAAREVQLSKGETNIVKINAFKLTHKIIKEEGFRGLFRGLDSTIAREMPGYFVFFGSYELTKKILTVKSSSEFIGITEVMLAGAAGGLSFWLCVFPADVVKSRLQVSNLQGNLFQLIYRIANTEGVRALYNGLGPTLIRTIPATAFLFLTFELSREILHNLINPKKSDYIF